MWIIWVAFLFIFIAACILGKLGGPVDDELENNGD